jgi:hypothetical protein
MTFNEIEPVEAFDFRTFQSLPSGRWQAGISRMLFGKYRVGISLKGAGVYVVSYWGGDQEVAPLLCGFLLGVCFWLPEEILPQELSLIFPIQEDKDLSANFFKELFKASAAAQSRAQAQN